MKLWDSSNNLTLPYSSLLHEEIHIIFYIWKDTKKFKQITTYFIRILALLTHYSFDIVMPTDAYWVIRAW